MSLRACIWEIILLMLIEVGNPFHWGWHHSLAGNHQLYIWREGLSSSIITFFHSFPFVFGFVAVVVVVFASKQESCCNGGVFLVSHFVVVVAVVARNKSHSWTTMVLQRQLLTLD